LKKIIIAIDGPAASGKGKIAKYISRKLKFQHLDSGILYRRIAYQININNIDISKTIHLKKFVSSIGKISYRDHKKLRAEKISKIASKIASLQFVRDAINQFQRKIVKNNYTKNGFVIDGRDIGSVVFKKADFKLYIDVKLTIRAKRRHKQLIDRGEKSIYPKILRDIKLRDKKDKSRKNSPLVIPKDAFIISNSGTFKSTLIQINKIIGNLI